MENPGTSTEGMQEIGVGSHLSHLGPFQGDILHLLRRKGEVEHLSNDAQESVGSAPDKREGFRLSAIG